MNDVRWFVLTPTPDRAQWEAAVAAAARDIGLTLVHERLEADGTLAVNPPGSLVLVEDAERVPPDLRATSWGVMVDPDLAGAAVAAAHGLDDDMGWRQASKLLAAAALVLDDRLARVGPQESPTVLRCGDLTIQVPHRTDTPRAGRRAFLNGFLDLPHALDARFELGAADIIYNDEASRPSRDGRIDMTGRPRVATYGPYLWVTPGKWRAAAEFELDADGARQRYTFQWGDTTVLTERSFRPERPGPYRLEIDVELDHLAALELRILKMQGTISGAMTFRRLEILRVA